MFTLDSDRKTANAFDASRFFEFVPDDEAYDPLTSLFAALLPRLPVRRDNFGSRRTVTVRKTARPDLAALDALGSEQYWWILLEYNGKKSFSDVRAGEILLVPDPAELNDMALTLHARENVFV